VGVYVESNGAKGYTKRWNITPFPGQVFDPDTLENFWRDHKPALAVMQIAPMDPLVFAAEFRKFLDELPQPLYICCDAPSQDFWFVNHYLGE
jgi:hypothetical protein